MHPSRPAYLLLLPLTPFNIHLLLLLAYCTFTPLPIPAYMPHKPSPTQLHPTYIQPIQPTPHLHTTYTLPTPWFLCTQSSATPTSPLPCCTGPTPTPHLHTIYTRLHPTYTPPTHSLHVAYTLVPLHSILCHSNLSVTMLYRANAVDANPKHVTLLPRIIGWESRAPFKAEHRSKVKRMQSMRSRCKEARIAEASVSYWRYSLPLRWVVSGDNSIST